MDNQILEGLSRYYTHLRLFGYMRLTDVNILLLIIFIQELLLDAHGEYTNEELLEIQGILTCLIGKSCLYVPEEHGSLVDYIGVGSGYDKDSIVDPGSEDRTDSTYRISEIEEFFRFTETGESFRVI